MSDRRTARLHLDADRITQYSRSGNFHSDAAEARRRGLPGLVAQGMQVAGPAFGLLLEAWGPGFAARGEMDLKFVGMVVDGQTVEAEVALDGDQAAITVTVPDAVTTAVVGSARRPSSP